MLCFHVGMCTSMLLADKNVSMQQVGKVSFQMLTFAFHATSQPFVYVFQVCLALLFFFLRSSHRFLMPTLDFDAGCIPHFCFLHILFFCSVRAMHVHSCFLENGLFAALSKFPVQPHRNAAVIGTSSSKTAVHLSCSVALQYCTEFDSLDSL